MNTRHEPEQGSRIRNADFGIENVEKAMEPGFSTAPEWVRELGFGAGIGLVNINKCSDTMKIESTLLQFPVLVKYTEENVSARDNIPTNQKNIPQSLKLVGGAKRRK